MATKLKNMHLTSVDLVRAGANQEADICLYKSAEAPGTRTDAKDDLLTQLADLLEERRLAAKNEPQRPPQINKEDPQEETYDNESQSFNELTAERTANEILYIYLSAIEDSIESIQTDDDLDEHEKNKVMHESLQEFIDAMEDLVPKLCKSKPEEDCDKSAEPKEEPEEYVEEIDTIEEIQKFNQNHGADGRFSSGGGGGAPRPTGRKSPTPAQSKSAQMKDGMTLNQRKDGDTLWNVQITPKGQKDRIQVGVYAKRKIDASNYLITNGYYGKQHSVTPNLASQVGNTMNN